MNGGFGGLVVCQRKGKLGLLNTRKQMKKPIDANVSYRILVITRWADSEGSIMTALRY